jgi:hypothetical protein
VTQSWAVIPSGTVRISHIDTLWNQNGSTSRPFDWSPISSYVAALVPQPDGSFQSLSGTAGTNGTFEIPNVPAGYYWLRLGPRDTYWTNSSIFDVLSNLSLTTGGPNMISGALNSTVLTSINLSVKGSAWAPLFDHTAPTAPTALAGSFNISALPYISADGPNVSNTKPIDLLWTSGNCAGGNVTSGDFSAFLSPSLMKPLTTDVEAGAVQYSDPFPTAWRRTFRVCQSASVAVPVPGGSTQSINLLNTQTTALPTTTVNL